jgi:Protein of unknown function (DUF742).
MIHSNRHPDDFWHDEAAGPVVRPYAMTGGRTEPTRGTFDLISLVVATRPAHSTLVGLEPEHHTIMRLCQAPISVAEVSAYLDLPLGIVRVMLGDLLDKGLILAREPITASGPPTEHLFRAVINGLRSL